MNVQRKLMSADEFLEWRQDQPGRWELVAGTPIQMMAGAKQRHDRIVVNTLVTIAPKLKGTACRPWTADIATRIPEGNVRQPDLTIDCGAIRDDGLDSTAPTAVFEVLSPSTRTFDQVRKVDEYKRVPSMRYIFLIDPDRPRVILWARMNAESAWIDEELIGLEAVARLPAIGVEIGLAEMYEGLTFEA